MLHIQNPTNNWLEAVDRLPDGFLIKATSVQWLAEARAHKPRLHCNLRYVNDGLQDVNPDDTDAIRENRARDWFNRFIDGTFLNGSTAGIPHYQAVDSIAWWNEMYADSQTTVEKELLWRQERIAARVWLNEYRNGPEAAKLNHIRLAIGSAAVGNDNPWQTAQTAVLYDCIVDYHAYAFWHMVGGIPMPAANNWADLSGRWERMDNEYKKRGYIVEWMFGESGPFESAVTGWKAPVCLNNSVSAYIAATKDFIDGCKSTAAYQNGRVLGFVLFTTGGGSQWKDFETRQPELNQLADMVKQEWTATAPPPPPPPPQPQKWNKLVYLVPQTTTSAQYDYVVNIAFPIKSEIAFSANSAFSRPADVNSHRVIVYDVAEWGGQQALEDWLSVQGYDNYNPLTEIEYRNFPAFAYNWLWPVKVAHHHVNSAFGVLRDYDGDGKFNDRHEGVDLYARTGDPVIASAAGTVVWASNKRQSTGTPSAYGYHVIIQHPGEIYETWYCHLSSLMSAQGSNVQQGDVIGLAGNTGNSTGPHLHFNMRKRGEIAGPGFVIPDVIDPMLLLGV